MVSIILPPFLAGLRIAFECPTLLFNIQQPMNLSILENLKYGICTFCLSPLLSLLLNLKLQMFHLLEKLKLDDEEMYKQKTLIKYHFRNTIKLELGFETIYQLAIQLILLFNAISETRTNEAFDVIFNDDFAKWTIVTSLILSTSWSFLSCSLAHTKGPSISLQKQFKPSNLPMPCI